MTNKSQIISISDLFSKSWSIYKKIWSTLFIISAITVFAWKIWQFFMVPYLLTISGLSTLTAGVISGNPSIAFSFGLIGLAVLLLSWIVIFEISFMGGAAIITALELHLQGKHPTVSTIYNKAKKLLFPLSIVAILVFMLELLGFIFFIIPGIILIFLLTFCNYIVVAEGKTGLAVLHRSIQLVKSHFWEIMLRFLIMGVISFLINAAFKKIFMFQFVSETLILPFSITYHYLLYKDVAEKK